MSKRKSIIELEELLLKIEYKNENIKEADTAFNDIFYTYSKILYNFVYHSFNQIGLNDEHFIKEVVNNTFFIMYQKPLSFQFPKEAKNDKCFVAWISTIAKNEAIRLINKQKKNTFLELNIDEDKEPENFEIEIDFEENDSKNMKKLKESLDKLTERNRQIFLASIMINSNENSNDEKKKYKKSKDLASICEIFQTTNHNIRQIQSRCFKFIYSDLGISKNIN